MDTLTFFGHVAYVLIAVGMWKLGRHDPKGFLFQAAGAAVWCVCGFFMRDAGQAVIIWNIIFGLIGVAGYRRLRDQ